ncbi:MAG: LPS assembly lipoprotein LptE [Aliarcobacter sp.]|nr:LPS assembly lipoprotein LptE [Aliarcobacter sp.]
MHILKKLLFVFFTFSITFSLVSCGYKPLSYYAKKEMEGNVFVKLNVSLVDPKNSVLVKDAVNKLLIQKLDSSLVNSEENADVIMNVSIDSVNIETLSYDTDGYNKLYNTVVVIGINYFRKDNGIKKSFTVEGEYDFSIDDGTTITETKRYDSISNAADKALDEVLSKIAVSSFK